MKKRVHALIIDEYGRLIFESGNNSLAYFCGGSVQRYWRIGRSNRIWLHVSPNKPRNMEGVYRVQVAMNNLQFIGKRGGESLLFGAKSALHYMQYVGKTVYVWVEIPS